VYAGGDDAGVRRGNFFKGLGGVTGHDLENLRECVILVAWIDAFGAVANKELFQPFDFGVLLEDGNADFFRCARIDCGFVYDNGSRLLVHADRGGSRDERAKIRNVRVIHRR